MLLENAGELLGRDNALTLEALIQLATQHNPTLLQAQQQINGTLGKAIEAGLYPNPTLAYVGEQILVNNDAGRNTAGEFQGGTIQQEIVTAHKLKLSREKYLHRARVAEFQAVAQQWRVCNDVRVHFWETVGQRQIIEIRCELLKSAEDAALTTREQYQLGQANRADLHRSNVELQKARLALMNSVNQYRRQFRELTALVGMEFDVLPVAGTLDESFGEPIDFESAAARLSSESPQILAARAKWQGDQVTLQRERAEPIPNIVVKGGVGRNFEVSDTVAMAQVSISVPIFDRNQGTIRQAEADLARQCAEVRRIELELRSQLANHHQDYLIGRQNAGEFERVILPEARAAYVEQLEAYKENRQDWKEVLHAQRDYYDLREQYVEWQVQMRRNETLIQGYLLHGGLMAAEGPTPVGHIDATARPR